MKKIAIFLVIVFIGLSFYSHFKFKCLPFDLKTDFVRTKEIIVDRMVYGAYDKTLWNINLSDKRLGESGRFGLCGDIRRKNEALDLAKKRRNLAEKFFEETRKGGEDMNYLNERMEKNKSLTEGVKLR